MSGKSVRIKLDEHKSLSGLLLMPEGAIACYVLAHGAGAGMSHPFLEAVADGLAARQIATLRYQFPSMEGGSKRPDKPEVAHKAVRAAVQAAAALAPSVPLFAGGKSFGGRMTSQAQAETPLPNVVGLIFIGFPLHPQGKPALARAEHLEQVNISMLFLQGSRDALASLPLITMVTNNLGKLAKLKIVEHADHSFHVSIKSGTTDSQVMSEILDLLVRFVSAHC